MKDSLRILLTVTIVPTLLSVNSYYFRRDGAESVMLDHNRLFEELGWNVVPFAMKHSQNLGTRWDSFFPEEMELGVDYGIWGKVTRIPKVVYSIEARKKINALCSIVNPDICHCHCIYHHLSPSILPALKELRIPVVMTLHDLKIACPAYHMFNRSGVCEACKPYKFYNVVKNKCVKNSFAISGLAMIEAYFQRFFEMYDRNVSVFVCPSRFYIEKLVEWGWSKDRFVHVPNPVDVELFSPNYQPGNAFLYLGRLSAEKGVGTLIKAAARAGVTLRIAGDGPQQASLQALAQNTNADVTFLGRLTLPELSKELNACRATVLPSECYENAPISVLESYASGKPVLVADIGGNPELVNAETGWLFESGSESDLAASLDKVAKTPDLMVFEMGRNARRLAERQFGLDTYRNRIMAVYERYQGRLGGVR